MIIGYIYQFSDGSFHDVRIKAALNKYLKDAELVINKAETIIARWVIKRKLNE